MDIFVKRPVVAIVVSLILVLAGIFSSTRIPVLQFPQIESANLRISTLYPGASADVVQGFITDPIERVAMTMPGVDYVDTRTSAGSSTVTVWLDLNENSSEALAELTSRLNQIQYELPAEALDPSVSVQRTDQETALFYLTVSSGGWSRAKLTDYLSRNVSPKLAAIDGVQSVGFEGGRNPAMRIWLDPMRLASVGMGADEVYKALLDNNVLAAVGRTENNKQQVNLLTNATLRTEEDFRQLIIKKDQDALVRLQDIAEVKMGEDRGDDLSRLDQSDTVFISIWSLPGSNAISIGDEVYSKLESINQGLPDNVEIGIGYDATVYMRNAIKEIFTTLIETVVLVGIVVLLCMGSFRSALVPLITIPISILGAIAVIYALGFTLNLLTILAIVLSVGLVVDDAIVVVENVARHMREGKSRLAAALISSRELFAPIVAMTLTLAAVYAPIGFVSGLTGALFREFTFTLAIAVLISGVVAITLSPIMSAYVCEEKGKEGWATRKVNAGFDRLKSFYAWMLAKIFTCRRQVLFAGGFFSLLVIPFYMTSSKELAPTEDQSSILLIVESAPNAQIDYTADYMHDVVDKAQEFPNLREMWQVLQPNGGFAGIEFADYAERDFTVQEKMPEAFEKMSNITGLRVFPVLSPALPTAGQFDVELVIQSSDSYEQMASYTDELIQAAYASGHFTFAPSCTR